MPSALRVNVSELLAAMRRRSMDPRKLAFAADVPRRAVHRALQYGTATEWVISCIAEALSVIPAQITTDEDLPALDEVKIDGAKLRAVMHRRGVSPDEVWRLTIRGGPSGSAIRRGLNGGCLDRIVAKDLASVLHVPLREITNKTENGS